MRTFATAAAIFLAASFARGDDSKWMMNYYKHPTPKEIPSRLAEWQKQGILAGEKTKGVAIGFLSQVMRDNPPLIQGWLTTWETFPEADKKTILMAAWYSGASQATDYFKSHNLNQFLKQKAPEPNSVSVDDPSRLDFYWARYFASGDASCIRRIISALEYEKYAGSLDKFKSSKKTDKDRKAAFYDLIFKSAMWSLQSNCKQDEKVYSICKELFLSHKLSKPEEIFLSVVLSKVHPDEFKLEFHKDT